MSAKPYRPSNGTEGMEFISHFCDRCVHETEGAPCRILTLTYLHEIGDPEYPPEWIREADGPRCTAFEEVGAKERAEQATFDARQATFPLCFGGAEKGGSE